MVKNVIRNRIPKIRINIIQPTIALSIKDSAVYNKYTKITGEISIRIPKISLTIPYYNIN